MSEGPDHSIENVTNLECYQNGNELHYVSEDGHLDIALTEASALTNKSLDSELNSPQAKSSYKERRGADRQNNALSEIESKFWAAWLEFSIVSEQAKKGIFTNNRLRTGLFHDNNWPTHQGGTYPSRRVIAPTSCTIRIRRASQPSQCVVYERNY